MAVAMESKPAFVSGKPRLLFEGVYETTFLPLANYDVTEDGQRFIMIKSDQELAPTQVNFVFSCFES